MPLIPFSEFTDPGARLPASNPAAGLVNPVLDAYCSVLDPVGDFYRDALNFVVPGLGDVADLPRQAIASSLCPGAPPPREIPSIGAPVFPSDTRCASQGSAGGVQYNKVGETWVQGGTFREEWDCTFSRGLPVEGIRYYPGTGETQYLGCLCVRFNGTTYIQGFTPEAILSSDVRLVATEAIFNPCAGCTTTPDRPSTPVLPERPIPPLPPTPPEIPINIEIPQLPGIPPLSFPVVYIPITPQLTLNAPITLAPRLNFSPNFAFSPKIEIGLGGGSVEGGGYPEPIPDVIEIITEGAGDCPDPCVPVDYNLIRDIAIQELDAKFPPARPFQEQTETFAVADSGTFGLPNFARWVRIQIVEPPRNRGEQEGNPGAPNVFYNGWFSFGMRDSAGIRRPIQYDLMSVEVPNNSDFFSYTIIGLGTARITVGFDIAI